MKKLRLQKSPFLNNWLISVRRVSLFGLRVEGLEGLDKTIDDVFKIFLSAASFLRFSFLYDKISQAFTLRFFFSLAAFDIACWFLCI